jgi:hypothetical protein
MQRLPVFPEGSSDIAISALADKALVAELDGIVGFFFARSVEHYLAMETQAYRALVAEAQDEMNRRRLARRLAEDRRVALAAILGTPDIMVQTNLYLRATRPSTPDQEYVGWHRESFYGPDMAASVNLWLPIRNVSIDNALRYVPDSTTIPEAAIRTEQVDDRSVARFSAGHRIGLLYAPKRIVGGVDLSRHKPFVVLPGEAAIFAGALIHGAAENRTAQIRFSVDFRLIAAENLSVSKQHFASGKQYFEAL